MTLKYVCLILLCNVNSILAKTFVCNQTAECGCSKMNAHLQKIVGGESAINSSWGWAVSLQKSPHNHLCGGVIISPFHIITAGHCVTNSFETIRRVKIVAGIDTLSQSTLSIAQIRDIAQVILHEEYDAVSLVNDIAILRLQEPLIISQEHGTAPICLPHSISASIALNYPKPNSSLVAIGWGTLKYLSKLSSPDIHLQQVTVNALTAEHQMCRSSIRNTQFQYCAGVAGGGKDTCQGDSGGPLMYFNSTTSQWILVGITSYGKGCGHPDFAGVYTRISVYYDWIQSIVNSSSSSFTNSLITIVISYLSIYIYF